MGLGFFLLEVEAVCLCRSSVQFGVPRETIRSSESIDPPGFVDKRNGRYAEDL